MNKNHRDIKTPYRSLTMKTKRSDKTGVDMILKSGMLLTDDSGLLDFVCRHILWRYHY